uniref:Uncharacterized protein n=1 Tax=Haptolina brevifila TaxID=156173 RepID=A0A7S2MDR7_9EUKA|mmetsp:Transcript_49922/g.99380  ORF Transcript_49922/g.99380 Transcript_49922/m.99380 type:complete len:172 (+) Transcript_49922:138-653(+)|eukprot:CAMPEP_0174718952 /NCGR_PEP_ID=MMETSP1094-20130205/30435_1 /TAXON_ID=156173 /ORGANISM="Chrysochromulina brevifilum, Strain UTEX LB 985" /LENGTH=171 /DNA_ID=CAMNT_0015919177 /DNA_START=137 /DNA_END=652 /DNA_ORIENTATION=-
MPFLQDEYAALAEGMRLGTLKPAADEPQMVTWIDKRYSNSHMSTHGPGLMPGFGEQVDSTLRTSIAYSFGNCNRKTAEKVFVSREISKGESISPGPLAYKIPTSIGPKGTAMTVSGRSPLYEFGHDPYDSLHRQTGELRELKARNVDVSAELATIRQSVHRVTGGMFGTTT